MRDSLTNVPDNGLWGSRPPSRRAANGVCASCLRGKSVALVGALLGVLFAGGCACKRHCPPPPEVPEKPVGYPCGPCAGYFPTCWRPWPDVCPSCPVFGVDEPTPTEMPMETVPLPPAAGEMTSPEGAPETPEMEIPPADAEPAAPERGALEDPPGGEQSSAPVLRSGPPTSRRVADNLPDWQMPPLPDATQTSLIRQTTEIEAEGRPAGTSRVVPAAQQGKPIIRRAVR